MVNYSTIVAAAVFLCGFLGHTNSQGNEPNVNDVLKAIPNNIDLNNVNITDLSSMNASVLPAIEEAKNLFKQKCDKNGGPEAFDNANRAKDSLEQCLKSFVNVTKLQEEMERYKPTGDLDLVFKNYCSKTPVLKKCVNNFTAAVEPCLEPEEKANGKIIQNITDSLLTFVCFKEGDRIALFISANGPECLESKTQGIQRCVNTTFGHLVPQIDPSTGSAPGLNNLPSLILGTKECNDISAVQSCIVKELENCSDPTPANIVDSIFNYILRETPCKNILAEYRSAASRSTTHLLTIMSIAIPLLRVI